MKQKAVFTCNKSIKISNCCFFAYNRPISSVTLLSPVKNSLVKIRREICSDQARLQTITVLNKYFSRFWQQGMDQFGSLGYTIMGKTADLTVVQKTIIDTLHKEGKPQTFIDKEAGCSQSAVSKHVNRKLSRRKKCERKRCKTKRENRSLMRIVKQNRFKNLGELYKEWTQAGVEASRVTTHRRVKELGYSCRQRHLTWAKEKKNWTVAQWSKVLFSDESKFCI